MTIKAIYETLIQSEADYAAVGALAGMSETVEYIALGTSLQAHHAALNDLRKALGITWPQFQALIADELASVAATAPGPGTANVGGAGGKDD